MKKLLFCSVLVIVFLALTVHPALSETNPQTGPSKTGSPATVEADASGLASSMPVIGNSDTKRYHLPGMRYYNKVKKYHRVYFETEQQAIDQGYYKAGTKRGSAISAKTTKQRAEKPAVVKKEPAALPVETVAVPVKPAADRKQTKDVLPEEKHPPVRKMESPPPASVSAAAGPEKEAENTLYLSLQDCLEIAFKQNRLRAVSGESIKIAEAQYQQALSGHWPQLKFSMTGMRMDEEPTFVFPSQPLSLGATTGQYLAEAIAVAQLAKLGMAPGTPGYDAALTAATQAAMQALSTASMPAYKVKLMDRDLLTSTLSLIMPVYTGGKVSALAKQAKAGVDASKVEAHQTDLQIIRDVKQYYYGYIFARNLHALGRETLERFEATEAITESVYQHGSGRVKKTDYLRSKMMTSAVRSVAELLKSNEELSKSALANVMGLSWNTPIAVTEKEIPFVSYSGNLDELVIRAHRHNPHMKQVRLGLVAREGKIAEARSGHLPVIAFFGNFTRLDNSYDGGAINDENRNSWQIGVSMELPLFNGLRTTREVQEAEHRLEKLKHESVLLQEGVALQVKNAFLQIARSQGQVTTMKEALAAASENRDLTVRAYAQDMMETKDVIEAQLMEFIMHSQYMKALYDHQVNTGALEYIIGNSLDESR